MWGWLKRVDWLSGGAYGLVVAALLVVFWPVTPPPPQATEGFPERISQAFLARTPDSEDLLIDDYDFFCFVPPFIRADNFLRDYGLNAEGEIFVDEGRFFLGLVRNMWLQEYKVLGLAESATLDHERYFNCHWAQSRKIVLTGDGHTATWRRVSVAPR